MASVLQHLFELAYRLFNLSCRSLIVAENNLRGDCVYTWSATGSVGHWTWQAPAPVPCTACQRAALKACVQIHVDYVLQDGPSNAANYLYSPCG